MGFIASAKARESRAATPARYITGGTPGKPPGWLMNLFGFTKTASGSVINETTALNLSAFWCAVEAISADVAKLPIGMYRREEGKRTELPDEPASVLMNRQPNDEMLPLTFRQTLTAHALTWGNGIAEIEWANNGVPLALWPVLPTDYRITRDRTPAKRLVYEIRESATSGGKTAGLYAENVFHVHGLGFDGTTGYSVVQQARESLGLTMAAERFGAALFGNGAIPSGVLKHPRTLSDPAAARLKRQFKEKTGGANQRELMLLEEGTEYSPIGVPPEDGQFLESRQFQIPEIARWFRMPPHKLMDLLRGTFSNIEHQSIEYVTDCLGAWLLRWEQEIDRKFFGARDRRYSRHNTASLLRGDMKSRYDAYAVARQWGWRNVNEIKALEDENGIGPEGDTYLVPMNMVAADKLGETQAENKANGTPPPPAPGIPAPPPPANPKNGLQNRDRLHMALMAGLPILEDALESSVHTAEDKAKRTAGKPGWADWAAKFPDEHREHVIGKVFPFAESAAGMAATFGVKMEARTIAHTIAAEHSAAIAACLAGDPATANTRIRAMAKPAAERHLKMIADSIPGA